MRGKFVFVGEHLGKEGKLKGILGSLPLKARLSLTITGESLSRSVKNITEEDMVYDIEQNRWEGTDSYSVKPRRTAEINGVNAYVYDTSNHSMGLMLESQEGKLIVAYRECIFIFSH